MVLFLVIMRCLGHRHYEKLQFQVGTVLISGRYAAFLVPSRSEFAVLWCDGAGSDGLVACCVRSRL